MTDLSRNARIKDILGHKIPDSATPDYEHDLPSAMRLYLRLPLCDIRRDRVVVWSGVGRQARPLDLKAVFDYDGSAEGLASAICDAFLWWHEASARKDIEFNFICIGDDTPHETGVWFVLDSDTPTIRFRNPVCGQSEFTLYNHSIDSDELVIRGRIKISSGIHVPVRLFNKE